MNLAQEKHLQPFTRAHCFEKYSISATFSVRFLRTACAELFDFQADQRFGVTSQPLDVRFRFLAGRL